MRDKISQAEIESAAAAQETKKAKETERYASRVLQSAEAVNKSRAKDRAARRALLGLKPES